MTQEHTKFACGNSLWRWAIVAGICLAYVVGGYSANHDLPPYSTLRMAKAYLRPPVPVPDRYTVGDAMRIIADEKKASIPCPRQAERSAVILVLGQSNAANHMGQRFRSEHGPHIVNYFDGSCFVAESPLLGASGVSGEYWTQLANLLVGSGKFTDVVLAPVASTGSEVARWARGGDLNKLVLEAAARLQQSGYRITHVIWHQGEKDYVDGTSEEAYRQRLKSLVATLHETGVQAPFFVSVASKCLGASNGGARFHQPDNPVVRAQRALPDRQMGIKGGVDTDAMMDELDRIDDCHLSGSGENKAARAWADLILADDERAALP